MGSDKWWLIFSPVNGLWLPLFLSLFIKDDSPPGITSDWFIASWIFGFLGSLTLILGGVMYIFSHISIGWN